MTELTEVTGRTAADIMHARVSTLPASTTIGELRAYFAESTSHQLALLVDGERFAGRIPVTAVPDDARDQAPAAPLAECDPVVAREAPAAGFCGT